MKKILHITECLGGGVETAICKYIEESPSKDLAHYVLSISGRSADSNGEVKKLLGVKLYEEESTKFNALFVILDYYARIGPDIIHLHSTFAGFLGRILFTLPRSKIIYTPHCYSFLMNDKPWYKRLLYRVVEELLNLRTGILAPCGLYEEIVHSSLFLKARCIPLNNSVTMKESKERSFLKQSGTINVGMSGRICPQKGYDFFIRLVEEVNKLDIAIAFYWIGGGKDKFVKELTAANVKVSGWLDKSEAITELKKMDIYVHTAAWEGNPLALIEASAIGIPIFARDIPATAVFGKKLCFSSPEKMALALQQFINSPESFTIPYDIGYNILEANRIDTLRHQLKNLYLDMKK